MALEITKSSLHRLEILQTALDWTCFDLYRQPDFPEPSCHRLVLSRLEFGNAVLVGIPANLLRRLQSVLNPAARLIIMIIIIVYYARKQQ